MEKLWHNIAYTTSTPLTNQQTCQNSAFWWFDGDDECGLYTLSTHMTGSDKWWWVARMSSDAKWLSVGCVVVKQAHHHLINEQAIFMWKSIKVVSFHHRHQHHSLSRLFDATSLILHCFVTNQLLLLFICDNHIHQKFIITWVGLPLTSKSIS